MRRLITDEYASPEVEEAYQHVLELRSSIHKTCELAKSELTKSQIRS